ncbi:hypothetical protein [Leeuwenhoekiella nanhaiensis]|uniref:hypothetical protein n=1 Tax=Leeuwenhoekiella nanhaiensis TaxID=1655491 RepID=UPI001CB8B5ED|nr:hypothetical protein [Leeuwenhoekiella nanhaiensis]
MGHFKFIEMPSITHVLAEVEKNSVVRKISNLSIFADPLGTARKSRKFLRTSEIYALASAFALFQ